MSQSIASRDPALKRRRSSMLSTLSLILACIFSPAAVFVAAPQTAAAQANFAIDGEWRGESSSNEVRIEARSGGIYVVAVTNHIDQSAPMFFAQSAPNEYRYDFGGGSQAVVRVMGPRDLRVTNPDGWTDLFHPLGR
jgi:hypothetical protein